MNATRTTSEFGIELIDHMGSDLSIVNAARVSLNRKSDVLSDADKGLMHYLMKNRHGTPFEMVQFCFRVTVPIFVAREWQRHRIGSFNEMSTRYVEMPQQAYLPPEADMRTQTGKPGHYLMAALEQADAYHALLIMQHTYFQIYEAYKTLLEMGLAKEVARNILPLGQMTQFIWSVNLRSLFNFLSLRLHGTALREIRYASTTIYLLAKNITPEAFAAWEENDRPTP